MIKHKRVGFTLVELLIVIVVIAILAAISIVAYNGVQQRAQDSQILSAAQQLQKAYVASIITSGNNAYLGGYASSYNASTNTCSGGYGGWVDDTSYSFNPSFCTIGTVLVAEGSIPPSLIKDLPKTNKVDTNYAGGNRTIMLYPCTSDSYALLYALNRPRSDQQTELESKCNPSGSGWAPFTDYGMNAGVTFPIPR